jgi:hypothetical protein
MPTFLMLSASSVRLSLVKRLRSFCAGDRALGEAPAPAAAAVVEIDVPGVAQPPEVTAQTALAALAAQRVAEQDVEGAGARFEDPENCPAERVIRAALLRRHRGTPFLLLFSEHRIGSRACPAWRKVASRSTLRERDPPHVPPTIA